MNPVSSDAAEATGDDRQDILLTGSHGLWHRY